MPLRDKEKRSEYNRAYRLAHKEKLDAYHKAYYKEYYKKNKEKVNKHNNEFRATNPDRKKDEDKKYRETHKDERAIYNKLYKILHPGWAAENIRKYRQNHPEETSAKFKIYQKKNRWKFRIYSETRRAKTKGNGGRYTPAEWLELCNYYGNICLCCGESLPLAGDHIVPIVSGGRNDIDNLQPLCGHDNRVKHSKTIDYRLARAVDGAIAMQSHGEMPELPKSYEHLKKWDLWASIR